jgi:hypothetical protein
MRFQIALVILASVLMSFQVQAKTRVAFLEEYDHGQLVQYEPGSRFGHSAIEINGRWLQSYPGEGVRFITWSQLSQRGHIAAVLEIPVDVTMNDVQKFLGKPFDFDYDWSDDAFYCSELLGKILGLAPKPMRFNHAVWPKWYWSKEGQPGLSPDEIYSDLKTKYSL